MKKLIIAVVATTISIPSVAHSQQTSYYQTCTAYRESYTPGYYDQNGNYIRGNVYTQSYNVPCGSNGTYYSRPVVQQVPRQRVCNPTAGALLGAGIAGAISGGGGYTNSGNWYRKYNKNKSSGGWSNTYKNNYSWQALGAGLGALAFSC